MRARLRLTLAGILTFVAAVLPARIHATADGPVVDVFEFVVDGEVMANCGDFLIIADGRGKNRITTYYDRAGNPVRGLFQGRYNGTMTNSVTGAVLLDAPSVANISYDFATGVQTNIGAFFTVTLPGHGAILIDAGRIAFDGTGDPIFIAGPHRPSDETITILCDALR